MQARPQKSNHRGAIEILRGAGHEKAVSSIEQSYPPMSMVFCGSWGAANLVGLAVPPSAAPYGRARV